MTSLTRLLALSVLFCLPLLTVFAGSFADEEPRWNNEGPTMAPPGLGDTADARAYPNILEKSFIVAYYGKPASTRMGILGEQPIAETAKLLIKTCQEWAPYVAPRKVIPALHLIYATVTPEASVIILSDKTIQTYIDFAAANNMIVILDHQIGKMSAASAMNAMLPWLRFPNVHLALDPEWKTTTPGITLGTIEAEDVNAAQQMMEDWMEAQGIEERRMLIVHQFNSKMIRNTALVRSDFPRIELVHHADGFGAPALKRDTYARLADYVNLPLKGFKLFLPKSWKTNGYDNPMLSMSQVLKLKPQPLYISYQ